jgi:formamidopyrimidine-DNA glycosylase
LLTQSFIAGIGNIYADEILFRAGITPRHAVSRLSPARLGALWARMREVLREALAQCGSSIRDYRDARGNAGAFQNNFRVYGRSGHPCHTCGCILEKGVVAGRGTVHCPVCQK